ncbi:PREDICTED: phytanoyl-CoA dioxygenase domain-containing protein 1-like [Priapulus caudatus]|uniref:Phytanoyl-CoA dioxygenase domain-containing protein 1-like n=1 Tax=Priapulus caudatus TaxID=37621 RepID=A0ABM1DP92_PRICU|nr:PREDICTED: phytanoyl-CoA dioxygenase domain-containing protein 1-like [Priapulus caudatus]
MANEDQARQFHEDGFLAIENFLSDDEINSMKTASKMLVDDMVPDEHKTIFKAGDKQKSNDYFMNSTDKIRFFFEDEAIGPNGELLVEKHNGLNKIGHALHWLNPAFKNVTFSKKIQEVAKNIGFQRPVVVQSMVILKPPRIGAAVGPHQDLSFLYTDPPKVVGFWLALDDATLENSCMWFSPKSHNGGIKLRYRRTPDENSTTMEFDNPTLRDEDYEWVPVPVKKGTLVLIHGAVAHKSEKNLSNKPRQIYTFHVAESENTTWSKLNWLQPTKELQFPQLFG